MSDDNTIPETGRIEARLAEARSRLNTWEFSRQAETKFPDVDSGDVMEERLKAQSAVMNVIEALRPYLVGDVPADYWRQSPENHPEDPAQWLYWDDHGNSGMAGLAHVMAYRGRVNEHTETEDTVNGRQTVTKREPALIPADALRNALAMVAQAAYELGFIEAPNSRRRAYDAGIGADETPPQPDVDQAATDGGDQQTDV